MRVLLLPAGRPAGRRRARPRRPASGGYRDSGCAFRHPEGCALEPAARPCACLFYMCDALRGELRARGDLEDLEAMCGELEQLVSRALAARNLRRAADDIQRLL